MKKITSILTFSILILFITIRCSSDGSDSSSGSEPNQDGKGGSLAVFALKGNYLYAVDHQSLNVFWIQDPANPVNVGKVNIGMDIETIFGLDNYLFIGSQTGMYIYDITNPENPERLSAARHFTACDPVVANQTHAFVTLHSNTVCGTTVNLLQVYDIADITYPKLIHQRNLVQPRGLALYDNYLIICDDELKIFNIEDPEKLTIVKALPYTFKDIVIFNDILFAFGEKHITQFQWNTHDFLSLEVVSTLNY